LLRMLSVVHSLTCEEMFPKRDNANNDASRIMVRFLQTLADGLQVSKRRV
jgi:hypothetical protein